MGRRTSSFHALTADAPTGNFSAPVSSVLNGTVLGASPVIENCHEEQVFEIQQRLIRAKNLILKGKSDAVFGVASVFGFRAMFKEDTAKKPVEATYDAVSSAQPKIGLKPDPDVPTAPRLACVNEDSAEEYKNLDLDFDPWERCSTAGSPRSNPVTSFYADGTAYIFLCPAYFKQEAESGNRHCPIVHNDRFAGDPNVLYKKYQVYTLIYQLLRFQLGDNALDADSDPPEQLDWNECVRLNAVSSIRNPTNFQLYVACKYSFPNIFLFESLLAGTMK